MTPYYSDRLLTVLAGDCRTVMAAMEPESVQCVVTSPPYFGLRDYGIEPSVWSGEAHEHEWGEAAVRRVGRNDTDPVTLARRAETYGTGRGAGTIAPASEVQAGSFCPCGAWLGVLGLEPTIEFYVAHMVEVFRGVRRVLRKDGTVWLNLGDSYAGGAGGRGDSGNEIDGKRTSQKQDGKRIPRALGNLKPKDRMMVPARVALALQADGWWLRDEIVWHKPNPMPSSVTDRTTPAHEMVYLLTRSARYFYDMEAVCEPSESGEGSRAGFGGYSARALAMGRQPSGNEKPGMCVVNGATRNKRSVWTIPTAPYPEAHFATFPPKLIEPMILAGTSAKGACPECGAPWARETSKTGSAGRDPDAAVWIAKSGVDPADLQRLGKSGAQRFYDDRLSGFTRYRSQLYDRSLADRLYTALGGWLSRAIAEACGTETTGWRPTCKCLDEWGVVDAVPCVILDPFGGSGTVGMVSRALGRKSVLIDLSTDYLGQMLKRATTDWDAHEPEPVVDVPAEGLWSA